MKKVLILIIIVTIIIGFTGCRKTQAAQLVDEQIERVGEINLDSESVIVAIELAVEQLSDNERNSLENLDKLVQLRREYDELRALADEALLVDELISNIGTVTLESESVIISAREKYNSCSDEAKQYVLLLNDLMNAESALLQCKADVVIDAINNIGTITLDSHEKIHNIRETYESLEPEVSELVSNSVKIDEAEIAFRNLQIEKATKLIDAIGAVSLDDIELINEAMSYYKSLPADVASMVINADIIINIDKTLEDLRKDYAKAFDNKCEKLYNNISSDTKQDKIEELKIEYDNLEPEIKKYVTKYDLINASYSKLYKELAKIVNEMINMIEEVHETTGINIFAGEMLQLCENEYNALPEEAAELVDRSPLDKALKEYNKCKKENDQKSEKKYANLAISDFKTIKSQYSSAKPYFAFVKNITVNGDNCILVYISYKVGRDYEEIVLHNLDTNQKIVNPERYYEKAIDRAFGNNKLELYDCLIDFLGGLAECSNGYVVVPEEF